jgi:asparagine synthase (glutamine-hydrolysing)
MCGIAGLVGTFDKQAAQGAVLGMTCALAHRGPDGEGVEAWGSAVLGHRRLAIFDLSELGRQPMLSPDQRVGVVFNGAVYNFRELRSSLEARGFAFKSETDTEVLVHGYREWGIDALVNRLRGMFAFALWDDSIRKLFLVRDRLGVKPLVYSVHRGQLAFASTVRALRRAGFAQGLDERAVAEYLEFGYVTDRRAIYSGIEKVPAATIVEWSEEGLSTREYWRPPVPEEASARVTFDEAVEASEKLFLRAVERRLQADVPVGALLSGGVDSTLVCWAIRELGGDITAFTVGTPDDPWDETKDATETARALGIRHRVLEITASDSPDITEMVEAYAEPFACASALGMLRVSRAVHNEATVLLTGDGGDDCFLGYPEHRHLWMAEKLARRLPGGTDKLWTILKKGLPQRGALKRAASFMDYTTGGLGAVISNHDGLPFYERREMLGERFEHGRKDWLRAEAWSFDSGRNVLAEFLEYDRHGRFVAEYMTKVDGATMKHALEARSPFLDQELWEYAAQLPFEVRLHKGRLKAVLRELARRRVGERVAFGKKRGFGVPVGRWIAGRWRSQVEETLRESILGSEGWIMTGPVLAYLKNLKPDASAPNQLWYLYVLENWLRYERGLGSHAETLETGFAHSSVDDAQHLLEGQEVAG